MESKDNFKTIQIQGVDFTYNEDIHYEKDGHIYCRKCDTQIDGRVFEIMENKKMICRNTCKCEVEERKKQEQRLRNQEIETLKSKCFIEKSQWYYTFENSDDEVDQELISKMKKYVDKFDNLKNKNTGLIIYGGVGAGKIYLTCSIVNAIIEKYMCECKMMNFSQILNELQKGGFNLDRNEYIKNLTNKTLLVIDDFGIERDTEYALEQIYNIINARYQKQKPIIITTNLDYVDLNKEQDNLMLTRIYSRILEMGVPLKVDGKDRRKEKSKLKIEQAKKELGID